MDKSKDKGKDKGKDRAFEVSPLLGAALGRLGIVRPTAVQAALLPLAATGRDVLARAPTGSGKTLAYALPIVQAVLDAKARAGPAEVARTRAVVLAPTRELCEQVAKAIDDLGLDVRVANVAGQGRLIRLALADRPDVVVATPSRLLSHVRSASLALDSLSHLVLDEADLILSYGHSADDIRAIIAAAPSVHQTFMLSATMTPDVEGLRGLLRDPAVLDIAETDSDLSQYGVRCPGEEDKFLLLYVMLRLRLVKGKSLVFVNSTDRSYRVKLFLERFGIRSGVLNAELPFNSRYHAVEEFNRGAFDHLIATDEAEVKKEYGVSRGIDFVDVACVLNFDLPPSARSYTHRVGRTARAGRAGMALSFVDPSEEEAWRRIEGDEGVQEYRFDMEQVEGFRYRMTDALRSVTKAAVREARIKEIKHEVVNSERLRAHFEENPKDLAFLQHDRPTHPSRVQPHLKHVPSYLAPRMPAVGPSSAEPAPSVPFRKRKRARGKAGKDPLKHFSIA